MNIILIDSDCKKYFSDENAVHQRLGDPECRVYQWNPSEPMEFEDHCRCVLISAMSSGVKKQPVKVTKVGRNDPCPCGSGLKWKKCNCKEYHS